MKRSRFSDEQVIAMLKEHEAGARVDELCRMRGCTATGGHCPPQLLKHALCVRDVGDENRAMRASS